MKKAKNFETALHARRAVRTSAMPPAACVHQNHTCALFSWAFAPESGMGTSMKRKSKNQLCALAALSVPRHAACSLCAFSTCTVFFMELCVREDMEVQV